MLKNTTKIGTLAAIALMFMLSSCVYYGQDGRNGEVYLEIEPSPHYYVEYFWDDNPSIPESFFWGYDYPSAPGTFEYEYALSDEFLYFGEYTLIPTAGELGGYGYDGHDGCDRFYTLFLYSGGGFVDFYTKAALPNAPLRDGKPYEVMSDTIIQFDGFQMQMTRNRIPSADAKPAHASKVGSDL